MFKEHKEHVDCWLKVHGVTGVDILNLENLDNDLRYFITKARKHISTTHLANPNTEVTQLYALLDLVFWTELGWQVLCD